MTKFEEELFYKVPCKFEITTEAEYKKSTLINHFKNWHSDEEFQELKEQNENQAESILLMLDEIKSLKSQLQQQALPVVPECVDLFIKECREFNYDLDQAFYEQEDGSEATENNKCILWRRNHPDEFARAWLDGYQVEKPQLFYLKNKLTTSYLALDINTGYYEHWGEEIIPKLLKKQGYKISFTQQEIDSMETGSYEQIEVVE